ncbi:hypothetical protein DFJ58DRAFT_729370 [Suillus subalutaceus]|uniref:uncharacterized protein n=1 Tax=Suillus subalutaceus TaxID=48586 RepID=UPI001B864CCC|nr:uncharacterized protein DFJ58DRAFT_729370 [Suillus subalutaceus]KAG1849905.1 hypothetical protein DFJ58DRAFT_729370 [Suillus subalutaceus]
MSFALDDRRQHTDTIDAMTANSKAKFSLVSDIIGALQNVLAHSQVIIPDLKTQYPISNTHYSAFNLNYQDISAIITERQQQLDAASHEISRFETVIDGINHIHQQLVAKKDKITQSMNSHKRLVSALWRLPAEVLSQIFAHCLPNRHRLSPTSKAVPMVLTRICRRWREVAVDMSSLWQGLNVDKDWQRAAFCYESWLKRSRGRPLSLELQCCKSNWTELRSLLQPYINQLSSLSLDFYHNDLQPEVIISDFLALEELTISLHFNYQAPVVQSISQPPCTLRSLTVTGTFFNMEYATTFNPAWTRLTNIQIDLDEPSAFPQLLRLCPSLSSLTITTFFITMETLEPFTHTQLQSLRIISNDYDHDNEPRNLFGTLSLPNLRALEARAMYSWPHEFKAFLTRSKCPLESLTLGSHLSVTDEQRAEYVALIPSLKVLVV